MIKKKPARAHGPRAMPGPRASTAAALRAVGKEFPTREVNLKHPLPPGAGPFGEGPDTDPGDSEALMRLRNIIDDEIGWASPAEEEAGDYEGRLRQLARQLDLDWAVRWVKGKVKR